MIVIFPSQHPGNVSEGGPRDRGIQKLDQK